MKSLFKLLAVHSLSKCHFRKLYGSYSMLLGKVLLIVFDKDGTLTDFNKLWTHPTINCCQRLEKYVNQPGIADEILKLFGYDANTSKWNDSLINYSGEIISHSLKDFLRQRSLSDDIIDKAVNNFWEKDSAHCGEVVPVVKDLEKILLSAKRKSIKLAVCTMDDQVATQTALNTLDIAHLIDDVICGDSARLHPKPSPQSILTICSRLNVPPSNTIVVGDSAVDIRMGKAAGVLANIGVLSGTGGKHDLSSADYIFRDVAEAMDFILQ